MLRLPPRCTRTDTPFPSATRFRSITLTFENGEPVALDGNRIGPVKVIQELQAMAQPYGIGRDIHVGDTIIGIKGRSEEHTSELQSLMRTSYAVFCLKKKKEYTITPSNKQLHTDYDEQNVRNE